MGPHAAYLDARAATPGSAGPAAIETAVHFEMLADLLLDAAPREQRIRRLGEALSATTRHLRTLEEREREEHLRLKHVQHGKARHAGR